MPTEEYTIILRGERFLLSSDQLHFDAPNYFTSLFQGPFQEAAEGKHEVVLYRDPHLFRVIETYLSGYQIFPLSNDGWPKHMSAEAAMKNLIEDAKFYGFEKLLLLLEKGEKQDKDKRYGIVVTKVHFTAQPSESKTAKIDAIDVAWIINHVLESNQYHLGLLTRCALSRIRSEGVSTDVDVLWSKNFEKFAVIWRIVGVSRGGTALVAQTNFIGLLDPVE